ncbi:MAG: penicillin-binding protein 2 [Thermoflexales bacterium]|nr:penicillin-binding protein 2 [Thermoflexales bacterium]
MPVHIRPRLTLLILLLAPLALLLLWRLLDVQVVHGLAYRQQAVQERTHNLTLPEPPRGSISDAHGFPLAVSVPRYTIWASPAYIKDAGAVAQILSPVLQVPADTLSATMAYTSQGVILAPYASWEQGEVVKKLKLAGVWATLRWRRQYPHQTLAAHLLGFTAYSGEGFYGLEGYYDRALRPQTVAQVVETDPSGLRPLPHEEGQVPTPQRGNHLVLTLDLAMQMAAEEELARALAEYQADSGLVIVMAPQTGAILAMAVQPSFDPNQYEVYMDERGEEVFLNPALSAQYEPGSIFKIITLAGALDSGAVSPQDTYVDTGQTEVGGQVITNWDGKAYGEQDLVGLMGHSLNVGAAWLATKMGPETFYRYVRAFGFGQPTGVDLQGEVAGTVHMPGDLDWYDSYLGANAYGQGIAVTPVQMAAAVAAVANGGHLMRPYVVARQIRPDGSALESRPVVRGQPISPETARAVSEILAQAVEEYMPQAAVPGYRVAGKTGTAQIPVPGGYDPRGTIASFVGYGPVEDPHLLILVRLDRPRTSPWASQTAAVVFQRLATRLFPMSRD